MVDGNAGEYRSIGYIISVKTNEWSGTPVEQYAHYAADGCPYALVPLGFHQTLQQSRCPYLDRHYIPVTSAPLFHLTNMSVLAE